MQLRARNAPSYDSLGLPYLLYSLTTEKYKHNSEVLSGPKGGPQALRPASLELVTVVPPLNLGGPATHPYLTQCTASKAVSQHQQQKRPGLTFMFISGKGQGKGDIRNFQTEPPAADSEAPIYVAHRP